MPESVDLARTPPVLEIVIGIGKPFTDRHRLRWRSRQRAKSSSWSLPPSFTFQRGTNQEGRRRCAAERKRNAPLRYRLIQGWSYFFSLPRM
jgi:hypothetical protein